MPSWAVHPLARYAAIDLFGLDDATGAPIEGDLEYAAGLEPDVAQDALKANPTIATMALTPVLQAQEAHQRRDKKARAMQGFLPARPSKEALGARLFEGSPAGQVAKSESSRF